MNKFKVVVASVGFALLSAFLFGFGGAAVDGNMSSTVNSDTVWTIDSNRMSSNSLLIAPFKSENIFISEVVESDFVFTSVGGDWVQYTPENTAVQVQVRFQVDGNWENWIDVETEDDQHQDNEGNSLTVNKYAFASTNPATAMQYKFVLLGDGISSPKVESPSWTFVKSTEDKGEQNYAVPRYGNSSSTAMVRNLTVNAATSGIISRSEWGANEDLRYQKKDVQDSSGNGLNGADDVSKDNDVSAYALEIKEDTRGDKYVWPLQYSYKVDRFVVHHTATSNNLDNPKQAIRDIYYYHAVSRGWGDIGYNYIIDKNGNIYEGRYGGEGVVAGHALGANNGSIGIAVLGNYENGEVPEAVINALGRLIGEKSKTHNVDPNGTSDWKGKVMSNVIAHRDVASTTCPGTFLYDRLPIIRSLAVQTSSNSSNYSSNAYDFNNVSGAQYLTMDPGGMVNLELQLVNIGRKSWGSGTKLLIKNAGDLANKVEVSGGSMSEGAVERGGTGNFKIAIRALGAGQLVYPEFVLQVDGRFETSKRIEIPVIVKSVMPSYSFVDANFPPAIMKHGETFQGWVKLKNTSNVTWHKSGANQISLKTARDVGRNFDFSRSGSDTIAFLREREVKPGDVGTFNLNLVAPNKTGSYNEYFVPFISGIGYLKDDSLSFAVNVYNPMNAGLGEAEVLRVASKADWTRNRSYRVGIKVMNETSTTWTAQNFTLEVESATGIEIRDKKFLPTSVKPGETANLSLVAKPVAGAKAGDGMLRVMPKVNGINLYKQALTVNYRVVENTAVPVASVPRPSSPVQTPSVVPTPVVNSNTSNVSLEDFRVKLGFSGDPEITANGVFQLYDGNKSVRNFSAGETVKVSMRGNDYRVEYGTTVALMSGPVRFVPNSGVIMEIKNYDNRPAWNTSLNDNTYLGVLEVNKENFKPIVINELPLEDYLKGLGEVSNSEHPEKIKAIMVAARTYAVFYMTKAEKFAGKPYHLDDSPERSQKYLGYGLTKRSPNVSIGVEATRGEVVKLNGEVVKTAYFNQSDGTSTKSAQEVWGWTDTPHLVSVADTYCKGDQFLGHGVGLSGCGAKGMAEAGKNYKEILTYFYKGTVINGL
ncbi:hypothetical protein CVV38_01990 [Candidatus Peregrinibacteria bacterium HGW-Peregrinibacteria-1]|jgi:hypothetical protein|nr:MAG: hypothetical protein CVV38_01990 [Candidatus Peregrinibacteria bacterium HGW-Peregrinibacteria-1]